MQELIHYSYAGLKMVFALRELLGTQEHFPEYGFKLQTNGMLKNGSIDLMLNGPNTLALLDFKRTGFSIPSKSELERFDKLQIWFYLNVLKAKEIWKDSQKNTIGYLNLSKPSESLIITNDQDIIAQIKSHEAFEQIRSVYYFDEEWSERFEKYQEFEESLLQSYQDIKSYRVAPRDADVCAYCPVSLVCPKQTAEVSHVEC
jgi:hypothetical protein